ncbi:MAG: thermonuclease family protein [Ilumatobacteraceae bacterium]|jgi:micrococcal nuclease
MARIHGAITAVFLSVLLYSCAQKQVTVTPDGRVHGVITHVTDGDTVSVRLGGTTEKIRLIGVDTPETKHPTKPVGCWGPEASAHTTALLPVGTDVYIVRDAEARDKYKRLLAYVYRTADNLFVNYELIAGGWGVPLSISPNTAFETDFASAAYSAQQANLGLWAHCRG